MVLKVIKKDFERLGNIRGLSINYVKQDAWNYCMDGDKSPIIFAAKSLMYALTPELVSENEVDGFPNLYSPFLNNAINLEKELVYLFLDEQTFSSIFNGFEEKTYRTQRKIVVAWSHMDSSHQLRLMAQRINEQDEGLSNLWMITLSPSIENDTSCGKPA